MKVWGIVFAAVIVTAALVVAVALNLKGKPWAPTPPPPETVSGPFSMFVIEAPDRIFNLGQGEYVVAMVSTSCEHCEEDMATLNEYAKSGVLPPIVALMFGMQSELDSMTAKLEIAFPAQVIEPTKFFQLVGNAPPRVHYVRDGRSVHFWDEKIPSQDEILRVVSAYRPQ